MCDYLPEKCKFTRSFGWTCFHAYFRKCIIQGIGKLLIYLIWQEDMAGVMEVWGIGIRAVVCNQFTMRWNGSPGLSLTFASSLPNQKVVVQLYFHVKC